MARPVGVERARYVEQIHDCHHSTLRYYFLKHLGDASAVDACVRETFRRFFDSAQSRGSEEEPASARVYLMRNAFAVCKERNARDGSPGPAWERVLRAQLAARKPTNVTRAGKSLLALPPEIPSV